MQRAMTIFNRTDLLARLRRQLVIDLYSHHGIAYWARVRANGLMLANDTGANLHVVELFAFFHDARRLSEHTDDGHGSRGAVLARRFKGRYFDATDDEVDLLQLACGRHSDGITRGDPTVMTCWDADRRVDITPNAKYLCTTFAKQDETIRRADRRAQHWVTVHDLR